MRDRKSGRETRAQRGFTLPEIMIAMALGVIVTGTILESYIWCGNQANLCSRIAWSQSTIMRTSTKIEAYVRNASSISGIDTTNGLWVEVRFTNGITGRLTYYNTTDTLRKGKMFLQQNTSTTEVLVAQGVTKIMDTTGFQIPVFTKLRDNAILFSYRVSDPTPSGIQAADDGDYAAYARFAVFLRNYGG